MSRPEQDLQKLVLEHLQWRRPKKSFVFHYPAGGWRSPVEAAIFQSLGVVAGVPDLLIIHGGRIYGLELKTKHGRLSGNQIETQDRMRAAGAIIATAVELDAALEQLERWGLLQPDVSTRRAS
jgi:hypothetical protein